MHPQLRVLAFVLIVLAAAPSIALAKLTAFEAMTSTVIQEGQSSFSGLGIRARLHPGPMVPEFELMPNLEWWRSSNSIKTYDIKTVRKDASLGIDARYNFKATGWSPYVGAGWALHFLSAEVDAPSLGLNNASTSLSKGGVTLLAGAAFPLTAKIDNFLDLKYHHVTDYKQLKLSFGITVKIP